METNASILLTAESALARGNRALRNGQYEEAIASYIRALLDMPELAAILAGNVAIARYRHLQQRSGVKRKHVCVCSFDLSSHTAERVYALAAMYGTFSGTIEIMGPVLNKTGYSETLAETGLAKKLNIRSFAVTEDGQFFRTALLHVAVHPYDLVHLSKAHPRNILIGLLYKFIWGSKVLIDIDDDGLTLLNGASTITVDEYIKKHGAYPGLERFDDQDWLRLAIGMIDVFDGVTLSNPQLQQRYAGEVVRTALDENFIKPSSEFKRAARRSFDLDDTKKVVLLMTHGGDESVLMDRVNMILRLQRQDIVFAFLDMPGTAGAIKRVKTVGVPYLLVREDSSSKPSKLAAAADIAIYSSAAEGDLAFSTPAILPDLLATGTVVLIDNIPAIADLPTNFGIVKVDRKDWRECIERVLGEQPLEPVVNDDSYQLFRNEFSFSANVPVLRRQYDALFKEKVDDFRRHDNFECLLTISGTSFFSDLARSTEMLAKSVMAKVAKPILHETVTPALQTEIKLVEPVAEADQESQAWIYSISEADLLTRVRTYNAQKSKRKAKVVVYCAIIGGYDPLMLPETIVDEWDYVIFCDSAVPGIDGEHIFEVRKPNYAHSDPSRIARYIKTHPHLYFPEYEYAIWIDANILVRGSHLKNAVDDCINRNVLMMLNPHPDRNCVYEELKACIKRAKDDKTVMEQQVARYRSEGFPALQGMFETGITIRKHNDPRIREFNEAWWHEIETGSRRDQLSITYVIWKQQLTYEVLPGMKNIRFHEENDYCLFPHGNKKDKHHPQYSQPTFLQRKAPVRNHDTQIQIDDETLLSRVREYLGKRSNSIVSKKKVVVYTAISNNYDVLKIPEMLCPEWDYVCFTDRQSIPGEHPWQIRHIDYIDADSTRTARYLKTHPHVYFPDYEYSIWIDAHILIRSDFLQLFTENFIKRQRKFAAIPHPFRSCTYVEGGLCSSEKKDDDAVVTAQLERYRQEGFPEHYGLIESGILLRKHSDASVRNVNILWWNEIEKGSKRDQLSLMYVLWKTNLEWFPLMKKGYSTRNHDGFRFFQHGLNETKRDARYRVPSFLPREFAFDQTPYWMVDETLFNKGSLDKYKNERVDIVICVHNALDDVKACVTSVLAALRSTHKVIIIDDGSGDETRLFLEEISANSPSIRLVRHNEAMGYTASASEGMRLSDAPFVILLNSDTIVVGDWALKMLQAATSSPDIGVVGPMSNAASWQSVPFLRDPKTGRMAINEIPSGMTVADMDTLCERYGWFEQFPRVPLVNGFCYGIKREVINAIGQFDKDAFPRGYGEEDDFSFRALNAGFIHAIASHCYVFHAKSKSFGSATRAVLAEAGGKMLRARHGEKRIERAVTLMGKQPLLQRLRRDLCNATSMPFTEQMRTSLDLPQQNIPSLASKGTGDVAKVGAKYSLSQLVKIDSEIFPHELLLAQITREELTANARFVEKMRSADIGKPRIALWILPNFKNVLAGGIRTLFMVAQNFSEEWGTTNLFVLFETKAQKKNIQDAQQIQRLFPNLKFSLMPLERDDDPMELPESDVAFCSSWPTAYVLARYNKCKAKFYFMQDYESQFYAAGSMSGLIDQTYSFGFHCIANTSGIADKYREFSSFVDYFIPGVDQKIYKPDLTKKPSDRWNIVFYGRPNNLRNGFPLGLEALKIVKERLGDRVRIVSVGGEWSPETYGVDGIVENLGVLGSLEEVAALYQSSHVGVVSMLTPHPSYQPLEYMACGCVTVTNQNKGTAWLFKHENNAILTSVVPSDMAEGIVRVLKDENLRNRLIAGGLETVKDMKWDTAFTKIRDYVTNPMKAGSHDY